MPNDYPDWAIELANPLFSNKFLKFEDIDTTDKEEKIKEGIRKIYDENEPIYFEHRVGETKEQTRERLNGLTTNPLFRNQIERCTTLLTEWLNHHFQEQAQTFIQRLNTFKDHLMTDHFFDHRSFMYSDAKKNFETIITFLNEPLLPENFLKNQINNLLKENSLELCSEGCNTLLGTVADALRNFGSFSVPTLSREFLIQHIEVEALRPFNSFRRDNAVETILAALDLSEGGNEVHGVNYLKNKASFFFDLSFLSVRDKFQENYDDRLAVRADNDSYSQRIKKSATHTVDNYLKQCRDKFTANNFVEFISRKLQEDLTLYHDAELINRLETQLSQMGEDQGFNFYELVDIGEKTTLKTDWRAFKITIAERLIASSYFEIDNSPNSRLRHNNNPFKRRNQISNNPNFLDQFKLKPGDAEYKIYFSNIDLTWVKIPDGEEEQKRQLFIELLKDQQGPEKLKKIVPLETNIFLDQLIQNTNDLEQSIKANENINWLEKFFSLPVKSALIKRLLIKSEDIKPFCNKFIAYFNSLIPFKGMDSNERDLKITSRIVNSNPNFTKKILTQAIYYLGTISNPNEFAIYTSKIFLNNPSNYYTFFRNLVESGFKDFSDLRFKSHSNLAFSLDNYKSQSNSIAYMTIDFEGVNLKNSIFELPVCHTNFFNSDLTGVQFKSILDGVDFKGANLFDTDFSNARLSNFAARPYKLSRQNLPYNKIAINFEGALFSTISFSQVLQLYLNLDPQYLAIDGELSRFKKLSFNHVRLQQVDFSDPDLHSILRFLGEIEFSNIELKNKVIDFSSLSGVILKITSSDLEESTLKNFKGSLNLESCHIQGLTFENCDLSHSMFSKNQGLEYYQDTTLNLKYFLAFSSIGPSSREKDYSGVFLTDTPQELAGNNAWFDKQQRFLRLRLSGQAFNFLIKKGFRSFPYVNLKNVELHQVDLSEIDIEKAKLHEVKLKDVQLNLEQFILFCERNHKDLSEVAIKGKFSAESAAKLKLFGVKLSEEAARYLLENGIKDFTGADLQNTRNLFEEYVGKPGYLFENAVFPTSHAESFKRKSERQSHIEALGDSQGNLPSLRK